jgi:hypothetical protein
MPSDQGKVAPEQEEGVWRIRAGTPEGRPRSETYRADGTENLAYNNPYALTIERVWCDGKVVYAVEQGELDLDLAKVKVAQEYQTVYAVELDGNGKLKGGREPERVEG